MALPQPFVPLAPALRSGCAVGGRRRRGNGAGFRIPRLPEQVRELQWLLGKNAVWTVIPREVLDRAQAKKVHCVHIGAPTDREANRFSQLGLRELTTQMHLPVWEMRVNARCCASLPPRTPGKTPGPKSWTRSRRRSPEGNLRISADLIGFAPVESHAVATAFDSGKMTSDAGACCWGEGPLSCRRSRSWRARCRPAAEFVTVGARYGPRSQRRHLILFRSNDRVFRYRHRR